MLQRHTAADTDLVDRLQRSAFDYFLIHTNPKNGLVADTSLAGSPCSIAATGFALSSYPVAVERGWIERGAAVETVLATLRFFQESDQGSSRQATGYRGFYYHFLDMHTGHRVWHCELSLIDSALLFAGMLTAAAYFTGDDPAEVEVRDLAKTLYERADWAWALNKGDTLVMGWKPGRFLKYRWQGYNEAIILYVLALASPTFPIPEKSYEAFTATYQWIQYEGLEYLYAGPLFIHLFSHAWIDFRAIQDRFMREKRSDYVRNTQSAIKAQRAYATHNPHGFAGYGTDVWGLTACDGPSARRRLRGGKRQHFVGYAARGAPFGPDDGTLAPWAPLACLPFDEQASTSGLQTILDRYPALLAHGRFPGSFNPTVVGEGPEGWIDERCVGIDQGLLVMMIENARTGQLWRLMRENPIIRDGLARAGFTGGWLSEEASAEALETV